MIPYNWKKQYKKNMLRKKDLRFKNSEIIKKSVSCLRQCINQKTPTVPKGKKSVSERSTNEAFSTPISNETAS